MVDRKPELRTAFLGGGWKEVGVDPTSTGVEFDVLMSVEYATCAAVVTASGAEAVALWAETQAALAQLRIDGVLNPKLDLYLVFLVERLADSEIQGLQLVLDDTRVCRKICVELGDRSITEALDDIPFFATAKTRTGEDGFVRALPAAFEVIPDEVQHDLVLRSADTILNKLLAGEYKDR